MGSKTYVSSTSYNLAGDVEDRPNFLQTTVMGSILSKNESYVSETIINAQLDGPGIKQRQFFNWAKKNFPMGMPTSEITSTFAIDPEIVISQIDVPVGQEIFMNRAFIEAADYNIFAEQQILKNSPELYDTEWVSDLDEANHRIIIQYEDASVELVPLPEYNQDRDYLVAYYHFVETTTFGDVNSSGRVNDITDEDDLPDVDPDMVSEDGTDGYSQTVGLSVVTSTVTSYSNDRSTVKQSSSEYPTQVWEHEHNIHSKGIARGTDGVSGRTINQVYKHHVWKNYSIEQNVEETSEETVIAGGVVQTRTTTVTTDVLVPVWSYEDTDQLIYLGAGVGDTQMLIYKMGSGNNTFDVLQSAADQPVNEFFPFIPLRLYNKSIRHSNFNGIFEDCKEAFEKGTDAKFDEVLDNIEENDSIGDIDHAFMNYGVSLNVAENASKKYLYNYLKTLIPHQTTTMADYNNFVGRKNTYGAQSVIYDRWFSAQSRYGDPLYGVDPPDKTALVKPEFTTVKINSTSSVVENYDMRISWITMDEDNFVGKAGGNSKKGDIYLEKGGTDDWIESGGDRSWYRADVDGKYEKTYIYWQYEENAYRRMTCVGLTHRNYVYGGKSVKITAHEALNDDEESSFIVPIHYPTLVSMSLVDATQMVTANTYITFNSYQVVKTGFFQSGFFKILLFIVVVAISIAFPPAAGATGILGASATVGATLGFTGTAALIAGAAANALAAMILTNLIVSASTELFGEKFGQVIGAILSFFVMTELTAFSTNGQFGADWGSMMRAENLMKLTSTAGNVYASWVRGDTLEVLEEMDQAEEEYEEQLDQIQDLTSDLGLMNGMVDPSVITNSILNPEMARESEKDFIGRTTMVGSDIVDLSLSLVYDYVEMNLRLPES